eukprot:gnl/TRDRNA2_/TRDRNA2_206324_c0_seq1.p1 gnl/TRDRNA2_/TRDRNA2_206324_c0~~gnl/TRDRNA2_/TRDRNA2_206324_c0_seq1.p1  ORF type:complete len:348 (+),score=37.87 gnl/TRDRNA2_/TRDRNA2_206324_c0_seq1:37-1080(+)
MLSLSLSLHDEWEIRFDDRTATVGDISDESVPNDSRLPPYIQDAFDNLMVHSDSIEVAILQEQEALRRTQHPSAPCLDRFARQIALHFFHVVMRRMKLPSCCWFTAAALLDTLRSPISSLPTTCAALASIVRKTESGKIIDEDEAHILIDETAIMANSLQTSMGMVTIAKADIELEEARVLQDLSWQVQLPTVESWIQTDCLRLTVLIGSTFAMPIESIKHQIVQVSRGIVLSKPLTGEFSQRKAAHGLVCLGLVAARLLPLDVFRPVEVDPEEFEEMFCCTCQWRLEDSVPTCLLTPETWECFVTAVSAATGRSIPELQQDTDRAARMILACIPHVISSKKYHVTL